MRYYSKTIMLMSLTFPLESKRYIEETDMVVDCFKYQSYLKQRRVAVINKQNMQYLHLYNKIVPHHLTYVLTLTLTGTNTNVIHWK